MRVSIGPGLESLSGDLDLPAGARGVVAFAHGSGSSRTSPRNRFVAAQLREGALGTLLIDLLTPGEEAVDARTRHLRFDIEMLADRMVRVVDWLRKDEEASQLSIGLFGASTGAAAALIAAARRPQVVGAVVSRGGRPDLAGSYLRDVAAPTLLIVGGRDAEVIELNRSAAARISAPKRLTIVPGASHLFEEPGTLGEVARLAREWFVQNLDNGKPDQ
ncbi:MAG: alpha/beta family hydrolase [Gemmatimonadota bacterium]